MGNACSQPRVIISDSDPCAEKSVSVTCLCTAPCELESRLLKEGLYRGLYIDYYSPRYVDRIWVIWGAYYNTPKAIFYLLEGDYNMEAFTCSVALLDGALFRAEHG